jgi:hypothetical protein
VLPLRETSVSLGLSILVLMGSCAGSPENSGKHGAGTDPAVKHRILAQHVRPEEEFPRLRFFDSGLVSLNDRCPVRRTKLSTKMPAMYVNGRPIGFC